MKIVWISPAGSGASIARSLAQQKHTVVSWGAEIGVPGIAQKGLAAFCQEADLVVVDGPFPLTRTARSYRPCDAALFFDELRRKHSVTALGPTPTVDLLVGDPRYFRKWCKRLSIPLDNAGLGEVDTVGAWFKDNDVVPAGPYMLSWAPIFKSVGFKGWFALDLAEGNAVRASAQWDPDSIPEGREAEFLRALL